MSSAIGDVGGGGEYLVNAICGEPFVIDQLADEELRQRLVDGVVGMDAEHAEGTCGVVAAALPLQREIVEVVDTAAAIAEERADVVGKPKSAEYVFEGLAGGGRKIRLG